MHDSAQARRFVAELLDGAVAQGIAPGAVALVWRDGESVWHSAHGVLATDPRSDVAGTPVTTDTVYDLASLTKVLSTTSLVALLVAEGRMRLEETVPTPWSAACPDATLRDLLEHAAGLVAHREYFTRVAPGAREALLAEVMATPAAAPPRKVALYSDLGFLILGAWIERVTGEPLDVAFENRIGGPIAKGSLAYRPRIGGRWPEAGLGIAPTEVYDPGLHAAEPTWLSLRAREAMMAHGVVHDDNCFVMDGVAGHAGLFGTARGVATVAQAWLDGDLPGVGAELRDTFWTASTVPGSTRRLGFDGVSEGGSTAGVTSQDAVGHLGYTGTSLWIDPPRRTLYVLLTNRVHPVRDDTRIRELRREFHKAASLL